MKELLAPINNFLHCSTPDEWVDAAVKSENRTVLLTDHMICELKAAQTAMWLIRRYAVDKESGDALLAWLAPYEDFIYRKNGSFESLSKLKNGLSKQIKAREDSPYGQDLIDKMVLLIKEELHHFYQVLEIITARDIKYDNISAGRYAKGLIKHVKNHEPDTLIDKLICGAYIEARSCERFAKLAPHLDTELEKFYISLLRSEARHYQDYLTLAEQIAGQDISQRIEFFGQVEAELILSTDKDFKFHSGVPAS
ncbi:tRNA isopentenyl-2-thiomethyl-A-37 hydroxylase MiaE [Catenovulum sediminis]|uniref:tRNA isopentenyl-2-thiomethyl-A-37 hydroxylase MiaE n=1 Tax=Catenovulum sediminis TaxID=1740262 RepID=UPI00118048F9|nr:tRNA isopentenyl-2-thiomethyl-A-37 hydroxylase MiaE [Catenovulum sediminis]